MGICGEINVNEIVGVDVFSTLRTGIFAVGFTVSAITGAIIVIEGFEEGLYDGIMLVE